MNRGATIVFTPDSAGAGSYPRSAGRRIAPLCNRLPRLGLPCFMTEAKQLDRHSDTNGVDTPCAVTYRRTWPPWFKYPPSRPGGTKLASIRALMERIGITR